MNILFLDQFTDPGGAQRCLTDLLPAVAARGWKAHIATPGNGLQIGPYHSGHKTAGDVLRFLRDMWRLPDAIESLARETRADLLYVNGPRLLPAIRSGRPVIFHAHNYLRQRYAVMLATRALRRTQAILIANCRYVAAPLEAHARATHVVYNGVPGQALLPARGGTIAAHPRITVIGRIAPEKGQAQLLRAARRLNHCHVTICGAPLFGDRDAQRYDRHLRTLAEGLDVEFTGWREDIAPVLAVTDLLVVPSVKPEATTRVIPEAFAAGVPVLAANTGGIPEVVTHEQTGFLMESLDPEPLAAQIRKLLDNPARLCAVAVAGHEAWRANYTLEHYQRGILNIIESAGPSVRT
jgi:glycosyltransferase involved in cell wall biosynthesis